MKYSLPFNNKPTAKNKKKMQPLLEEKKTIYVFANSDEFERMVRFAVSIRDANLHFLTSHSFDFINNSKKPIFIIDSSLGEEFIKRLVVSNIIDLKRSILVGEPIKGINFPIKAPKKVHSIKSALSLLGV